MSLRRALVIAGILLSSGALCDPRTPVVASVKEVMIYRPETYIIRQGCIVYNKLAKYQLNLTQSGASSNRLPVVRLTLLPGNSNYGFCPLTTFLKLKINGIKIDKLLIKKEDITAWRKETFAGCEIKLNFNGARLLIRFFMKPNSPLLWGTIIPAENTIDPIHEAEVQFSTIPSMLKVRNKKLISSGVYERMVITPARTIKQSAQPVPLSFKDSRLIFQDAVFDGSSKDKGNGPCVLWLNYSAVSEAVLRIDNNWTSGVKVTLKPGFKDFCFALWQQGRIANNELEKIKLPEHL